MSIQAEEDRPCCANCVPWGVALPRPEGAVFICHRFPKTEQKQPQQFCGEHPRLRAVSLSLPQVQMPPAQPEPGSAPASSKPFFKRNKR